MQDTTLLYKNQFYFYMLVHLKLKFKNTPFTIAKLKAKSLRIKCDKDVQNLYTKKYKTLLREIKEQMENQVVQLKYIQ